MTCHTEDIVDIQRNGACLCTADADVREEDAVASVGPRTIASLEEEDIKPLHGKENLVATLVRFAAHRARIDGEVNERDIMVICDQA